MMGEAHHHFSRVSNLPCVGYFKLIMNYLQTGRLVRLIKQFASRRLELFAQINALHDRVEQLQRELDFPNSQGVSDYGSSIV